MWNNIVFFVVAGLLCVDAQVIQSGQCDNNVTLEANFNIERFLGTWYEIRNTETPWRGDCATIEFTANGNNNYTVYQRSVNQNFLQEQYGSASIESGSQISLLLPQVSSQSINFWVQLTDYDNYALVYGCQNVGDTQRQVYFWQLSRNTTFIHELVPALLNQTMFETASLSNQDLREVNHGNDACYLLPLLQAGEPIIVPGSCNENILGLNNFDVGRFLGVWHEVNSYYSGNVFGTCGRAQYSDGGSVVNVVNSQISNSTLFTIEGFASLIGNDSRARLNVTLEVLPGVIDTSELFVLGTDYDQWAVSYACVNLQNNTKQLFSWIVSRTRVLPESARNEVNQVINSYVELNQEFYQNTDQSEEGCFYAPEPQFNQAVVFGGQCAQNVTGIPDFDASLYLGTWYEIEAYPALNQSGSCAKAEYSLGDGVVDVVNTQVVNQALETATAWAVPVGGSQLLVTFPIPGTNATVNTDYIVLATDYGNYSLVYSCSNINDYQQRVSLWKLSRNKELSVAASEAINNATLNSLPVVQQRYFQQTDQSDEACFYLPEPNGQVVRIPGQCEHHNISAVQNFNLSAFTGVWYEVEAYPKDQQQGQCINHQFGAVSGSQLSIESSSVVDQLPSISIGSLTSLSLTSEGRFILSVQTSNGTVSFPYDIIDIDYNDYAVAYSCANDGNDFMNVYSWKLSRSPQLSQSAITNIANAISNITIIDDRYFETVGQDDNACFTFPENLFQGSPVILDGQCGNVQALQNFSAGDYLGRWHLIESYPSDNQGGSCNTQVLNLALNGSVEVVNSQIVNQTLFTDIGIAQLSNDSSALLEVTFPNALEPFQLYVLDTDYFSYSLVYGCVNLSNNTYRVYSWKMSRSKSLNQADFNAIQATVDSIPVLNNRYYVQIDQSTEGCFYYPPVGAPTVLFPGRCDENIQVVGDFDAGEYLGLWHDILSYPLPFQMGGCPNARYSLGQNGVDVFNTQVINQTLDTIEGLAVLANASSTEGKLIVSFPSLGPFTSKYWVLAVDYNDFAIVYSCVNVPHDGEEYQQISSWVLSRSKTLSANATAAYLNVTNTVPVLDDRYYIRRDQSDEACFFYPTPEPGKPVVFYGTCDSNVTVMENFNMSRFSGVWFEIESYPKVQQTGDCVSHEFSIQAGDTLGLQSFNVIAESLGVTNGIVSRNDTSGRLTINFISNNTNYEIPYWIVDTDYDNYALVYSCVDNDDNTKGVWSWKLSRSKELSNSSIQSIASASASIDVLEDRYYETVDQSEDACFHLPDLLPGEPVIFQGQCPNILAVPNFNASGYLGRWHLIESYPSDNQGGSCNTQVLNLVNGSVEVVNSQIVNQTLFTDIGIAQLSNDSSALLTVTFPNASEPFLLYVLDTDYDSYSLVYGCVNLNNSTYRVFSWKMSRSKSLNQADFNAIQATVDSIPVLNNRYYEQIDQSTEGCFYYPPVGAPTVLFPGRCDENIQVVGDFDAAEYLGLWHDILSYPLPFQMGDCPNARYSLGQNGVDVFNTQVINQTLDTIEGLAVLANATSTEGKLIVSFPSLGPFTSKYWVLAVDYNDFAIVYSCDNVGDDYQQISSWVLSRSKTLSANATAAYLNVTNTVPVLDDRYYIRRDQSDEACFFYPTPEPGKPVVFYGTCDNNVTVVQNFNLTRFSGVWFEIESYPKVQQTGDCVSHEFSIQAGDTLGLQSFNVIAESLGVTNGVVSRNDTSGRLTINFISNNTNYEIPYWIVDTDYDNYALVYSCVDNDDNTKGVWSWKLSRSKELSNSSIQSIANASASIDVLDDKFYETVDQSEDACFHLPDLLPGEPVIFQGQCANISAVPNFNASRYLGVWKLIETYPSNFQNGACGEAEYALGANNTVIVTNSEVVNQTLNVDVGSAVLVDSGVFVVNFPNNTESLQLLVLDTDYESYSIVYACSNIDTDQRRVFSWKLSRFNTLTGNANTAIEAVLNRTNVLNQRYYVQTDRSAQACFYYPEPTGGPVRFRAQCDLSIPVVTDFNPVAYGGLWHDIASYPTPDQGGQCSNAHYTLGPNGVDVFNTQVINQTLDTIEGLAVLANASSTEAKLLVNFPSQGNTTSDYWVLSTDYDSYALVYSCFNLDDEYMLVFSWKLSRSRSLSANATNEINNAINQVPVLADRYYIQKDQSDEACFYFPDPQPGVPVRFPGICEANVPVVQNFNLSRFQGTWYEIETYPKEQQTGQCISHEFTVSGNSFDLISNNVMNGIVGVTNSTVNFASSNDTSGKFVITIQSNNSSGNASSIEIPYWIVDTDYDNYALAYSCVDFENERGLNERGVYSWKLSRTQQLTAPSVQAINNASANIDVIDNRYFEAVQHDNNACFYVPDLNPGDSIIFPGQCEVNVSGVENFDAGRYLGTWNLIENYASDFQFGTCADATYSLTTNGSVLVVNTEVINQTLSTTTGSAVLALNTSGVLIVTFPDAPPIEYIILDTDYDSYSLVYSCKNINPTQRRVYSWKLSRENSLSANATAAINAVINNTDILEQRFYQAVNRSYDDCFYFPEPSDSPVEFRGSCDPNVTVVQNFDAGRYLGKWNLIENYPSVFQFGTCATAEYSLAENGTVIVLNQEVVNQTLYSEIGLAVVVGNAKLSVTFPNAIQPIDYWVLDTDYDTYSLVYSCENRPNNRRRVLSWKLSRSNVFPNVPTVDAAISQVDVLDQRYYKTVDRSNTACFYYPEPTGNVVDFPGQCDPNVAVVPNFDAGRYLGKWNLIENYPSVFQLGTCATAEYSLAENGTVIVLNQEIVNQTVYSDIGLAVVVGNAKLSVTFPDAPEPIDYWVLDTDYDNYSLVYSCQNINETRRRVFSWKLSRSNVFPNVPSVDAAISQVDVLDQRYYKTVDRSNAGCLYYPEPTGNVVDFPGQCDPNVAVVPNFDAGRYLGKWNLIENYPSVFQLGTCATADYSLAENGTVIVLNQEVVNETLYSDVGLAVVVGNAKLSVTFPDAPEPIDYWVLDTDYDNYSLVYSCQNINATRRRVFSWKLSRENFLSQPHINAINAVMNQVDVLDQRYYQVVDRTDTGCFYYPEPSDYPVIFPGSCDPGVSPVPNFDIARYEGTWYQIERYPQTFEATDSSCAGARYEFDQNEGVVNVVNWEVVNGSLWSLEGTAVPASSDGSANFTVELPNLATGDGTTTSSLYILATDYENYSLAYSCSNLEGNRRTIGAWKLSRGRNLSPEASSLIDTAMSQRQVLRQKYFRDVEQNDECLEPSSSGSFIRSSIIIVLALTLMQYFV